MQKYEYVFSGPSMFDFCPQARYDPEEGHLNLVRESIITSVTKLKSELSVLDISSLFNAFTEKKFGEYYNQNSKFGMSNIFVDSGGLQMVTKNMTITEEKKLEIYEVQSKHEFAMCFDEIPCRDRPGSQSANSRSNISAKLYYPDLARDSALKTAENIKKQIEYFQRNNSTTQIFYIVQGNTWQDMVEWFEVGCSILTEEHFKNIAGIALADTCMGNGKLETVDMIRAYLKIKDHPLLINSKRLHLLGVGSVSRLYPFLLLKHLIGEDIITSFDSSSYSQAWNMGGLSDGTSRLKGKGVLNFIEEATKYYFDATGLEYSDFFVTHIIRNMRKKSSIYKEIPEENRIETTAIIRSLIIFITFFQVRGMDAAIAEILSTMKFDNSPEGMLQFIKTEEDFISWERDFGRFIESKRIERFNPNKNSLEMFF